MKIRSLLLFGFKVATGTLAHGFITMELDPDSKTMRFLGSDTGDFSSGGFGDASVYWDHGYSSQSPSQIW